jgi:Leucine-rich repeat (LRR) protein
MQGLEAFSSLQSLSLASLGLKNLEGLAACPHLTALAINDNNIGGTALTALSTLSKLRRLDLAGFLLADCFNRGGS